MAVDLTIALIVRRDPDPMVTVEGAAVKVKARAHTRSRGAALRMAV